MSSSEDLVLAGSIEHVRQRVTAGLDGTLSIDEMFLALKSITHLAEGKAIEVFVMDDTRQNTRQSLRMQDIPSFPETTGFILAVNPDKPSEFHCYQVDNAPDQKKLDRLNTLDELLESFNTMTGQALTREAFLVEMKQELDNVPVFFATSSTFFQSQKEMLQSYSGQPIDGIALCTIENFQGEQAQFEPPEENTPRVKHYDRLKKGYSHFFTKTWPKIAAAPYVGVVKLFDHIAESGCIGHSKQNPNIKVARAGYVVAAVFTVIPVLFSLTVATALISLVIASLAALSAAIALPIAKGIDARNNAR